MNHEPECPWRFEEDCYVPAAGITFCDIARNAYKRGRDDAAKAFETALNDYMYGEEYGPPELRLIAAARGDGERE